jgi:hypothetical protein
LKRHGTHGVFAPLDVPMRAGRIDSLDSRLLRFQIVFLFQCREGPMSISIAHIQPIVALIAGVLILIMPRLLNFIVAIYLILVGIIGLGIIK